jgi:hypothetical protein
MISASEQFYEKPAEADMLFVLFFTWKDLQSDFLKNSFKKTINKEYFLL